MSDEAGPAAYPLAVAALRAASSGADPAAGTDTTSALYAALLDWVGARGLELYPHQDEAILELLLGRHVVLATPTGSGKSLVALAGHAHALAEGRRSVYTAPIKALVNEKFFALCEAFGPERVGLLTGDATVNPQAPILACTAEVLANIALREGRATSAGLVVMDEFHYYADRQRGWAWQVPLLELVDAQFLLMSATLGDLTRVVADLRRRTGREVAQVTSAHRPVPLHFSWSLTPLAEQVEELVATGRAPVYVVHPTQAMAAAHAQDLRGLSLLSAAQRAAVADRLARVRFAAGFGRTLAALLRKGIGVHHAGMLPRYRRLVEQLAQAGLLMVVCGTDTLGVGINVPIRTVLLTRLTKFDGRRERVLTAREFHQICGRAGRAGFDTVGDVVVQAPAHVIDNARALARAGDDPRKLRKLRKAAPPEGTIVWNEATFQRLVAAAPEPLVSRMRVDNAMIVNVLARPGDPVRALSRLTRDNHEDPTGRARLARRAIRLGRSLLDSGVVVRLPEPDPTGRTLALTVELPDDFALHQPLAHFALAALDLLDPASPTHSLDVVSVVEAVLEDPTPVLRAQQWQARGEALAQLKSDGVDYEERMALLDEIGWPMPLADLLTTGYAAYRTSHPWLPEEALSPKSVVRQMWEQGLGFTDLIGRYGLARSEGVVLRYLTDAYRTLRQTVPAGYRDDTLEELLEWLGETVRQTDSSLLQEWESLLAPGQPATARQPDAGEPGRPPRPLTANEGALRAMIRRAMWRRVQLAARDDVTGLAAAEAASAGVTEPPRPVLLDGPAWDAALEGYFAEHDEIATDADARGPSLLQVDVAPEGGAGLAQEAGLPATTRLWRVRQALPDPEGDLDWGIEALVDLDASDRAGELVLTCTAMRRL